VNAAVAARRVRRRLYRQHPPREAYEPTARCRELEPVLRELIAWGKRHVPGVAQRRPARIDRAAGSNA